MMSQKFFRVSMVFVLAFWLSIPSVFAAKGDDALVTVVAVDSSNVSPSSDPVPVSGAYINMYEITLQDTEYVGVVVATMKADKEGAIFTVKSGQVVDFMAFGSKEAAEKQKNFISAGIPPFKNFSMDDGVAGVCHTHGSDFSAKLAGLTTACGTSLQVSVTGPLPSVTPVPPKTKGKTVLYRVQVAEKITAQNINLDAVLLPFKYVNMYEITFVNGEYKGKFLKTRKTGKKTGASFAVKAGQVVDFMGFSTKVAAKAAKTFVTNGVPPLKNFSPVYGPGLCHTNGTDFTKKLVSKDSCTKKGIVELSE